MSDGDTDPLDPIKGLAEKYSQVRLGRGVVGKTGAVTLGLFGLWAIILWRLSGSAWLDLALLAAGLAVTCVYLWWARKAHNFAEKHPGVALLEGAHLVEYQKFEAEAKGMLKPPPGRRRIVVAQPKAVEKPDE